MKLAASRIPALVGLSLCLTTGAAHGVASAWVENGPSRLRLITPYAVAPATGELRLGLQLQMRPGWHVYWKNSGDAGYPPRIDFAPAPGLVSSELLWPSPDRFELAGGLVAFGYEKEIVYPVRVRLSAGAGDRLKLLADVDYLVCQVDCIPYRTKLELEQPLGAESQDPATTNLIATGWARLPSPLAMVAGVTAETALAAGARPSAGPALVVRVHGVEKTPQSNLFLEPQESYETGKPQVVPSADGVTFRVPLTAKTAGKESEALVLAWTATGLRHDGGPLALEDRQRLDPRSAALPAEAIPPAAGSPAGRSRGPRELIALAAVVSLVLALWLWGLVAPADPAPPGPRPRTLRGALGFAAAAGTLGALYELAHAVRFETLAAVEMSLLALALTAWLRRRATRRGALSGALTVALAACALAALFLARRSC